MVAERFPRQLFSLVLRVQQVVIDDLVLRPVQRASVFQNPRDLSVNGLDEVDSAHGPRGQSPRQPRGHVEEDGAKKWDVSHGDKGRVGLVEANHGRVGEIRIRDCVEVLVEAVGGDHFHGYGGKRTVEVDYVVGVSLGGQYEDETVDLELIRIAYGLGL